jgi:hypothetical protein
MPNRINVAEPEGNYDAFAGPDVDEPQVREKITDPTLDPGDPRWNPKKYFDLQPKVVITVLRNQSDILSDPRNERDIILPVSINGYRLDIVKGQPTRVPRDFADHLVDIGAAYRDVQARDAREG